MQNETTGLWFATNMAFLFLCSYALIRFMRFLQDNATGALTLRVKASYIPSCETADLKWIDFFACSQCKVAFCTLM